MLDYHHHDNMSNVPDTVSRKNFKYNVEQGFGNAKK